MKSYNLFLKLLLIFFFLFNISFTYAHDHKNNKIPELEYFGTIKFDNFGIENTSKQFFVANINDGTLILANGDKGKLVSPCADFGEFKTSLSINLGVRCSITMDDGSYLYIYYGGKMIMDEKADQLMKEDKTLKPGNGLSYWISSPQIRTTSEKYAYMNDIQLIGKGSEAKFTPPTTVTYNLYKVIYTK
tara:strand:- start:379 stop:945 length:567 start_codon:yes stop_codon:yes gene_type:complete